MDGKEKHVTSKITKNNIKLKKKETLMERGWWRPQKHPLQNPNKESKSISPHSIQDKICVHQALWVCMHETLWGRRPRSNMGLCLGTLVNHIQTTLTNFLFFSFLFFNFPNHHFFNIFFPLISFHKGCLWMCTHHQTYLIPLVGLSTKFLYPINNGV